MDILEAARAAHRAAEVSQSGDLEAHDQLLKSAQRLLLLAETPQEKLARLRFQVIENFCHQIAIETGVLQAIAARDGTPITASDLSKETNTDELLIVRIMRPLTAVGLCKETGVNEYAATAVTVVATTLPMIGGMRVYTDLAFPIGSNLVNMLRTTGLHQFPKKCQRGPFESTFGVKLFDYLRQHPDLHEAYDNYMTGRRQLDAPQWFDVYPVASQIDRVKLRAGPQEILLVDVGGGQGHEAAKFSQRFSPLLPGRLIVEDLPETLGDTQRFDPVELFPYDFFTEQPIKAARMYYMRAVLHGWDDELCRNILKNTIAAMDEEYSVLLIDEHVLPDLGVDIRGASLDVSMMMFGSGGIERTTAQWQDLVSSVGLEIVKVWQVMSGYESVIECRIKTMI